MAILNFSKITCTFPDGDCKMWIIYNFNFSFLRLQKIMKFIHELWISVKPWKNTCTSLYRGERDCKNLNNFHFKILDLWTILNFSSIFKKYCANTQTHFADALTRNIHKSDTTASNICYANNRRSMIKSRWPLYQEFGSHMKKDNANRLADPENLYTGTRFQEDSEKK